jgi:hypothetical protein
MVLIFAVLAKHRPMASMQIKPDKREITVIAQKTMRMMKPGIVIFFA